MYEVKNTQKSMDDVMCSKWNTNECKCKVEDKPVMKQAVEKIVDEEPVDATDENTDEMVYNAQGGMSKKFMGGMFSGGGISPFNETNSLQFAVSIVIVILVGSLGLYGLFAAFRTENVIKNVAFYQALLLLGLSLVYSFDKNSNDLYNILKLLSVALLSVVLFFSSLNKNLSMTILVLISVIVLIMNVGMFDGIDIAGLQLNNNKELITRIVSTIIFLLLWGTKIYCILEDGSYCISNFDFNSGKSATIAPQKSVVSPQRGGKRYKRK
jgi:hypothetical protein